MRKIIIIIILCLLLIGSGFIFVKGNQKVNIYGVKDIDFVAKKLYREMSVYNTKENDSK